MRNELKKALDILVSGTQLEFKEAKKKIEHLRRISKNGEFQREAIIVFEYLDKFNEIKNVKNQEAFISGISLFYLVLADQHFEKLSDFTLRVIQNSNGHVRESVRKSSEWLAISLSSRFDNPKIKIQNQSRSEFYGYLTKIENLMYKYDNFNQKSPKYIEDMEPSIAKSLQFLWSGVSRLLKRMVKSSPDIIKKREEIEMKLSKILRENKIDASFYEIKDMIFEEKDHKDFGEIISLFKKIKSIEDLNIIMQVISEAWSYFPNRSLNGKCPKEIAQKYEIESIFESGYPKVQA